MGMYTEVDAGDGTSVQFSTGDDQCQIYKVGDPVAWFINPRDAGVGCCLDGAYDGEAFAYEKDGQGVLRLIHKGHFWVVIKDHVVVALVPCELNDPEDAERIDREGRFRGGVEAQRAYIERKYAVELTPITAWPDSAWARKAKDEEWARRRQRKWDAEDYGKPPEKAGCDAVNRFTKWRMKEEGLARRILGPILTPSNAPDRSVPLPPSALELAMLAKLSSHVGERQA